MSLDLAKQDNDGRPLPSFSDLKIFFQHLQNVSNPCVTEI